MSGLVMIPRTRGDSAAFYSEDLQLPDQIPVKMIPRGLSFTNPIDRDPCDDFARFQTLLAREISDGLGLTKREINVTGTGEELKQLKP